MFEPLSSIEYVAGNKNSQFLICMLEPMGVVAESNLKDKVTALFVFKQGIIFDLVRDLLYNPQVRSLIVVPGITEFAKEFVDFWTRKLEIPGLPQEHSEMLRNFVGLYDGDFHMRGVLPPYNPTRVRWP